jgi:hypothetical protein
MDKTQLDDIEYFKQKLALAETHKNTEEIERCKRRLKMMEDSLIIYNLHHPIRHA